MNHMEVLFGLFLNSLLCLLSYVVPKRPGTILLGGGLGNRFSGNTKYFYLYLCKEAQLENKPFCQFAWATKNRNLYDQLVSNNRPALLTWSLAGFWAILRSEQLVVESGNAPGAGGHDIAYERILPGRFNIFQTWHGTPLKHIGLDFFRDRKNLKWYERLYFWIYSRELSSLSSVLALSDIARQRFISAFNNFNVDILGYPKNDVFYDDPASWDINPLCQSYERVLLYAPTFRDSPGVEQPFSQEYYKTLNSRLKSENWCLLVKRHHFDTTMNLPAGMSNIFDVSGEIDDIQQILAQADILISDYSSTFIDYLLRGKPVIFYIYDLENYLDKSRKMYCKYIDEVPGPFARTEEELTDLIFQSHKWFEESSYQEKFEIALSFYHEFQDGKSCARYQNMLLSHSKLTHQSISQQ